DFARSRTALEVECQPGVRGRWDRAGLAEIVSSVLANALKYTRGEPVSVSVAGASERAPIVVRDRGIGISQEDQERIFERFERAASAEHYGGLGLGLWVARQVVEALHGRIRVESRPGEGSTFEVVLPRARVAEAA